MKTMKANLTSRPTKDLPPARAKTPTLTPWFSRDVAPVRAGVYQRKYGSGVAYSRWDGKLWRAGSYEFDLAKKRKEASYQPRLPWRGLASDPAKASA